MSTVNLILLRERKKNPNLTIIGAALQHVADLDGIGGHNSRWTMVEDVLL